MELFPGRNFEHALDDVAGFSHLWLIFWFHESQGWRPKVLPPRSTERHGVFATRSPYRPNPLGLSLVELASVDGLTLNVRGVDMLDGSPLLDIKPHIPYADSAEDVRTGWLGPLPTQSPAASDLDPEPGFCVTFSPLAARQSAFLRDGYGLDLQSALMQTLELGPQPHPYRRIRRTAEGLRVAIKDWRANFEVEGRQITVTRIESGYRPRQLWNDKGAELEVHRAFVSEFENTPELTNE